MMMMWECIPCGMFNKQEALHCSRCYTDKEEATQKVLFRKRMCEECNHRHKENTYCHVLLEKTEFDDDIDNNDDDDSGSDSDNVDDDDLVDSDDDDDRKKKIKPNSGKLGFDFLVTAANQTAKDEKKKKLSTPDHARKIGFGRCNCRIGVPSKSLRFEPVAANMHVGGIRILQYDDLKELEDTTSMIKKTIALEKDTLKMERLKQLELLKEQQKLEMMPTIYSYIALHDMAFPAKVNKAWNFGANLYNEYRDVRDCVPWQIIKPHRGPVDAVYLSGSLLFSTGDKTLVASDIQTGAVIHQITKDTAPFVLLTAIEEKLLCGSANGSIMAFPFNYDARRMKMEKSFWRHAAAIRGGIIGSPLPGVCTRHGLENHSCLFYTASEDRSIEVWDTNTLESVRTIHNFHIRRYTYQSLAQSAQHILAGTSGAVVMVFSKYNVCYREDVHSCSSPGVDKTYCLQVCLRLPPKASYSGNTPVIHALLCAGPNYSQSLLWAGDSTGTLTLWRVPEEGINYVPFRTSQIHTGAIRCLQSTWKHAISAGDDGCIILHELTTLTKIRKINILYWGVYRGLITNAEIPRRIKCMFIAENFETGGYLIVGTSYGELLVSSIGMYV